MIKGRKAKRCGRNGCSYRSGHGGEHEKHGWGPVDRKSTDGTIVAPERNPLRREQGTGV